MSKKKIGRQNEWNEKNRGKSHELGKGFFMPLLEKLENGIKKNDGLENPWS